MSYYQLLQSKSDQEIYILYQKYQSMSSILRHFGIKRNPRCCKLIAQKIKNISGVDVHSKKFSKKILPIEEIRLIAANSRSKTEVMRKMNLEPYSGNYSRIKKIFEINNIQLSINIIEKHNKNSYQRFYSNEEVYCINSEYSKHALVKRVFNEHWMPYACTECANIGLWNNKQLKLQLDHINGISSDNRKENLRWLCPNCHSQTPTFSGKKLKLAPSVGIEPTTSRLIGDV